MARAALLRWLFLLGVGAASGTAQDTPSARPQPESLTPAEREWQSLYEELVVKLVNFKALPEAEQRKETFALELARIDGYVRKFEKTDPWSATNARVFMAVQILGPALHRERDAVAILSNVALQSSSSDLAGIAAQQAGEFLLRLGDEEGLTALRNGYAERPERDAAIATRLAQLCRQVRLQPGRPFPALPLADLDGQKIELAGMKGKLVALLVFNLDHEGSRQRLEQLARWLAQRADPGVAAVGISLDKDPERVRRDAVKVRATFPIDCSGKEWEGPAVKELALTTIPALFVLDPDGRILVARPIQPAADLAALLDDEVRKQRTAGKLPPKPEPKQGR
jgi:peroxiredoxin